MLDTCKTSVQGLNAWMSLFRALCAFIKGLSSVCQTT